jgi:hypothetical protein
VSPRSEDDVHPRARVRRPAAPQDDDALAAIEGEGLPTQALDIRASEDDVAPRQQRIERRHAQLGGERVERLRGDHRHRRITVRRATGVPVTDHAEACPHLELLAPVAGLLRDDRARPAVVAVPGRGEQADDLDDVQRRPGQARAPSIRP